MCVEKGTAHKNNQRRGREEKAEEGRRRKERELLALD
jgi:hypothetical protein